MRENRQARFLDAVTKLVEDLKKGGHIRPGLRVKRVRTEKQEVWEMTRAPDGRALFEYGPTQRPGHKHIIWRRIGTHDILREP